MEDKDVKIKMSICPECKNTIRVAVEHEMDEAGIIEFSREVFELNLQVKTITLQEYRNSNIQMYCRDNCSRNNPTQIGDKTVPKHV